MADIIEARVRQKTATLDNWNSNPLVLLSGEQAFVVNDNGDPVNFKIGDGTKTFAELPFWIDYSQAAYIPYTASPAQDVAYTIVGPGNYGSITVADGYMAVLGWNGSSWSKDTEMYVKGPAGTNAQSFNFKGNVSDYASLPSSGNVQNDAWYNLDDKLLYVYNGSIYPPDGDGIDLAGGEGNDQDLQSVLTNGAISDIPLVIANDINISDPNTTTIETTEYGGEITNRTSADINTFAKLRLESYHDAQFAELSIGRDGGGLYWQRYIRIYESHIETNLPIITLGHETKWSAYGSLPIIFNISTEINFKLVNNGGLVHPSFQNKTGSPVTISYSDTRDAGLTQVSVNAMGETILNQVTGDNGYNTVLVYGELFFYRLSWHTNSGGVMFWFCVEKLSY